MGRRDANHSHSVSPVRFSADAEGNVTGWSQTMRRVGPEQSLNWTIRQNGKFKKEDVHPCNEGFPGLVRIGPTDGGWPMMFDVVLADGTRARALVSEKKVDGLPSWLLLGDGSSRNVSYYEVAGWATPSRDYDQFERALLWLIRHLPGGRR